MTPTHWLTLLLGAVATALGPVQQYAVGLPAWLHVLLLTISGTCTVMVAALTVPSLTQQAAPKPAAAPAPAPAPVLAPPGASA